MDNENTKTRTLSYRRAVWRSDTQNLEEHLKEAHNLFPFTKQRTCAYYETELQCLQAASKPGVGMFFHLAKYVPQQSTSLVPVPSDSTTKSTSPLPPPDNHSFLDGDIFFLVAGNHLIVCPSGANESIVSAYIINIFKKSGKTELISKYSIEKVANLDKVKLLQTEGVKKVVLDSSLYKASVDYAARTTTRKTLLNKFADDFMALFGDEEDDDLRDIKDKENLTVRLEISYDTRKKGGEVGAKRIERTADKLIEDKEDEGFAIVTRKGKRLKPNEITVNKKVDLPVDGSSVLQADAWEKLETYYRELSGSGMLEQ